MCSVRFKQVCVCVNYCMCYTRAVHCRGLLHFNYDTVATLYIVSLAALYGKVALIDYGYIHYQFLHSFYPDIAVLYSVHYIGSLLYILLILFSTDYFTLCKELNFIVVLALFTFSIGVQYIVGMDTGINRI